MKTRFYYIILLLGTQVILLLSCERTHYNEHQYLGKLPALYNEYQQDKNGLKYESRMSASIGKSLEAKSEIKNLDKKYKRQFREEYKKLDLPVHIPVEGKLDYTNHEIQEIYISEITPDGKVKLCAESVAKTDSSFLIAFAYFADSENQPVSSDPFIILTLPTAHRGEISPELIEKGSSIQLEGYCHYLVELTDAYKIIVISEEKYNNL